MIAPAKSTADGCPSLIAMSGVRTPRTLPPLQILQHPFPQHPVHPRLIPLPILLQPRQPGAPSFAILRRVGYRAPRSTAFRPPQIPLTILFQLRAPLASNLLCGRSTRQQRRQVSLPRRSQSPPGPSRLGLSGGTPPQSSNAPPRRTAMNVPNPVRITPVRLFVAALSLLCIPVLAQNVVVTPAPATAVTVT